MPNEGTKLFPDDIRTIAFVTGKIRTIITAKIIFNNKAAMAAIPDWVCQSVFSPEGIMLKENLFVDSHSVYNIENQECLQILDWFPEVVDRDNTLVRGTLIPWEDIKAFKAQTKTEPV